MTRLGKTLAALALGASLGLSTVAVAQDVKHDRQDLRHDRKDLRHDNRDRVHDRRDVRHDRRDLHRDVHGK